MKFRITPDGLVPYIVILILVGNFILSYVSYPFGESAGNNISNLILISFSVLMLLYLALRSEKLRPHFSLPKSAVISLLILVALFIVTSFFSYDTYRSAYETLRWIAALGAFFALLIWTSRNPQSFSKVAAACVACAAALSIAGFYLYTTQFGAQRLGSLLYQQNAFGGLLLIPLFLAVALAFETPTRLLKIVCTLLAALIGGAFILTFSRGSWLSLIIALIAAAILFRKHYSPKSLIVSKILLGAVFGSFIVALGIYGLAVHEAKVHQSTFSVFGGHLAPDVAGGDRLHYFKDALGTISRHPLGVGPGNYAVAAQADRTHVPYFSFDPHNLYLKLMAEIGVLGGIAFLIFLASCGIFVLRQLQKKDACAGSVLPYAAACGLIASIIHNGMDVDLLYVTDLFMFFMVAGALVGYAASLKQASSPSDSKLTSAATIAVVTICIACSLISIPLYMSNNAFEDGIFYSGDGKNDKAIAAYNVAEHYFPFNYTLYLNRGQLYFEHALALSGTEKARYFDLAMKELKTSEKYRRYGSKIYEAESEILEKSGDEQGAVTAMEKAVKADPLNNIDNHLRLALLYWKEGRYADNIKLADFTASKYPPELFGAYYWGDPYQAQWKTDIKGLLGLENLSYLKLKNPAGAALAAEKLKAYGN